MAYVDGFLIPVPTKNLAAYKKMSQKAGVVWMEHGALDYKECAGDDMDIEGMSTSFKTFTSKSSETVVFSWIVYASKAERARILKNVMADPRLNDMMNAKNHPFDPKKMLYGGFNVIVDMAPNAAPKRAKKAVKKKPAVKKKARR
ncbi:MAG: DUF1428 domain-containing protein [Hyphomonadaceae bacterium]